MNYGNSTLYAYEEALNELDDAKQLLRIANRDKAFAEHWLQKKHPAIYSELQRAIAANQLRRDKASENKPKQTTAGNTQ